MQVNDLVICIDKSSEFYLKTGMITGISNHYIDSVEIDYGNDEEEEVLKKDILGRYKKIMTTYEV